MQDFARCAVLLASPATAPALRAQADGWLAAFRREPAAWDVAVGVLRAGPAAMPPEVRLQAAALLAFKCKQQLVQLQPVERQLELVEALTALTAEGQLSEQPDVTQRALCVALANLAIHCTAWSRPLDMLALRLSAACMLEFLTLLPQECEDAVAAAQSASAEVAWALKARAHEWSAEVVAFLRSALAKACSPVASPSPQAVAAAALARPQLMQLTLAVLRCFTAWTKLGCLQHLDAEQAAFFASLAGELLFVADPQSGLPYHPLCLPAAVDAASEVIEHATEALQPLLVQLAAALPQRAAALCASGYEDEAAELAHVFAVFCSTHCTLCGSEGPEGEALRQGLLQLLALPRQAATEGSGAALPAMAAMADLLDQLLRHHRSTCSPGDAGHGSEQATGVVGQPGRHAFAASALQVLLVQLQPFAAAFEMQLAEPPASKLVQQGPEVVPDNLRREAAAVTEGIAELLGADKAVQQLVAHVQTSAERLGLQSPACQAALDASVHLLGSMSGLLESCCACWSAGDPPPGWLPGILRLFSLVPEAASATAGPLVTILHTDLLNCWCQLGPVIMPLLQAQHQQDMQQLILGRALFAMSGCRGTADAQACSPDDVVERAASALRVLCSAAVAASLPTSAELLEGLQRGMVLLRQPSRHQHCEEAHSQMVTGLVHALHGVPPGDLQLRALAESVVQAAVFQPVAAALQDVHGLIAGGAAAQLAAVRTATWHLHAALRQLQALLNGLESYADGMPSCSDGGTAGDSCGPVAIESCAWADKEALARGVAAAAVAALLSCWPQLAEVCGWLGRLPARAAPARQELYEELSQCLCSAMVLEPEAAQQVLPSFANTVAATYFLPGASALGRPLLQALELYGGKDGFQQPLLATVAAILAQPPARQLAAVRGGDADPEAAQALLSLLSCCARLARQWRSVSAPAAVEAVLSLGLPLAAGNTACNHRDTALQAMGTLSAILALVLAPDSPLHSALLCFAAEHGAAILQGVLLALLSLSSAGSSLPKVVGLMGDTALLASSLAIAEVRRLHGQAGGPANLSADAVSDAAGRLLESWLPTAQATVLSSGLISGQDLAALLSQWDWRPVLQQAAAELLQSSSGARGGSSSVAEARRAMQRSVRKLADLLRRPPGHLH